MLIPHGLLSVSSFADAIGAELVASRSLIPDDMTTRELLLSEKDHLSVWAHRRSSGEFTPVPAQIVNVRKSGHGIRPVAELSLRDRLTYHALVNRWQGTLPNPDHSGNSYEAFLTAPLDATDSSSYIVTSDITACYEYIDHGLLAREILARTGDSAGVKALTDLLGGLTGRSFGLPQQSQDSDILAEAYLSIIERRLLRLGLAIWRYNDDFRIAAQNWSSALMAIDALDRECRKFGLTLNGAKTIIRKRATYTRSLNRRSALLNDLSTDGVDLADVATSPYAADSDDTADSTLMTTAALSVVERWNNLEERSLTSNLLQRLTPDEMETRSVLAELMRWSLMTLSTSPIEPLVLRACSQALRSEQSLTPYVARYLRVASRNDDVALTPWFESFLNTNPYLTHWQAWWIAPEIRNFSGSYARASKQLAWLQSVWRDSTCPEPVRAGLALCAAQTGIAEASELLQVYESMTDIGRPLLAFAIGAISPASDPGPATLLEEDQLISLSFERGRATCG